MKRKLCFTFNSLLTRLVTRNLLRELPHTSSDPTFSPYTSAIRRKLERPMMIRFQFILFKLLVLLLVVSTVVAVSKLFKGK